MKPQHKCILIKVDQL